jgi:hypothetical protein
MNKSNYTYKVKNIGLGSPGALYLPSKGQKAPKIGKIGKMSLKWARSGYILL